MTRMWNKGDRVECDLSFSRADVTDVPDGFIKGIASTPATDLYGHKVMAKAFDRSIQAKGLSGPRGVKLLAHHDWHKPAGVIHKLATVNNNLEIEAQLNLNVSYVKDLYEVAKQNNGLSFSVGFTLDEFEFNEITEGDDDPWLIVKSGDLLEVSIVAFPALPEAEMTFVKTQPNTMAEFEKALVADGLCQSRSEAHKFTLAVKRNVHLFTTAPAAEPEHTHPMLDVGQLKAATDLVVKFKAMLGSR